MYNNIGGKIKGAAATIAIFEGLGALITGLCVMGCFQDEAGISIGLIIIIIGILFAWVSSWLLYGYGELIEKTCEIAKAVTHTNSDAPVDEYIGKTFVTSGAMNIPKRNGGTENGI